MLTTAKQKNSVSLQDTANLYISESSSDKADIKLVQENEVWESSLDLSKSKKVKLSLIEKSEWFLKCKSEGTHQPEEIEQKVYIRLPTIDEEAAFDTRIDFIFSGAFLENLWQTIRANAIIKCIPTILFFLFGSIDYLFGSYLVIAFFCVFLGAIRDISKNKFSVIRINKAIGQQILMLFAISISYLFIKGLINQQYLGNKFIYFRDVLVVWFFVTNFLSTVKHLSVLGVQFPKSLMPKIGAIKTIFD